ncbi:50S ribosomal protein L35 [Glycomyces albidus]|jgi:large subunit ribosomal protein L35|uniref:Large ribosomal subunit protein bL35 n=1 Tax=Glycomyces albidus TaxID=2656774 RepID=A0A6L5G4J0_9ACTN|nr:50S ribosomal protein L35 [Glycomyces albidus]MQM24554.1 50S ribosomal protein L35 [Glycomyces albidus]
MPKMKTHSGAKKRFKVTGSGKLMRRSAGKNHLMEHKSGRFKREAQGRSEVSPADQKQVRKLLGR